MGLGRAEDEQHSMFRERGSPRPGGPSRSVGSQGKTGSGTSPRSPTSCTPSLGRWLAAPVGRRLQLPLRFLPLALALLSVGLGRRCVEGGVGGTEMLDGQALQVARSASLCRAAVGRGVAVRVERGASLKSDSSTVLREDLRVRAYSVRRTYTQSRDRAFVLLVRGVAVV